MKNIPAILLILILTAACSSKKDISKADFEPVNDSVPSSAKGVFYHLPRTVIEVEVTARKVIEKRGPFYRYSRRYLDLSDVITEDNTYWEITDASISTTGTPDPDRLFRISAKGTPAGAAVSLTPEGTLKGFNLSNQKSMSGKSTDKQNDPDTTLSTEDISFDDVPFTEEQLIKTSSAATAEEVAQEIYNLRDTRRRLLESDMDNLPPDDGAYNRILHDISKLEQQYLSLFKGKQEKITQTKTFRFIPEASTPIDEVLFRFSKEKGFTDMDDMSGTPVYIEIGNAPVAENRRFSASPDKTRTGLIYCRPVKATVQVIDRTVLLNEKEVMIGQFGSLHQLSPELLDNGKPSIQLDPKTGAIIEIHTNQ
ncbi:MAG: DUF4831 family protein [Marinilabiliaceae bacterium]